MKHMSPICDIYVDLVRESVRRKVILKVLVKVMKATGRILLSLTQNLIE